VKFWSYIETGDREYDGFSINDVQEVLAGTTDLAVYGYVKYLDGFGESHETRMAYRFDWKSQDFRLNLLVPASYHKCN
jgi:hypothetical protein